MAADLAGRARRVFAYSLLAALAAAALCPLVGLDLESLRSGTGPDWLIFRNLRVPRTLLALLTGAALAGSGALYQALMREALATPSSLGVSAMASLGAVTAIAFYPGDDRGVPLVWLAALAGAAAGIGLIAGLGQARRFSTGTLLLTGIAVNGICTSLILLLHNLAGITKSFQITHWLMGGLEAVEYPALGLLAAAVVPGCAWLLAQARVLNVMSYGDQWAAGRGIDTRRFTWKGFALGAALVGTTTAITGPIAFVGLLVPHLLRRITGPDYRLLLPASVFGGAAFLVVCDTISRTVLSPVEIPVGVVTALLGGPFFVWLLWSR
jgi:iron complex transport system permease protein